MSDIDILVKMEPERSLFDLGGLLYELQNLLGVFKYGLKEQVQAAVRAI